MNQLPRHTVKPGVMDLPMPIIEAWKTPKALLKELGAPEPEMPPFDEESLKEEWMVFEEGDE